MNNKGAEPMPPEQDPNREKLPHPVYYVDSATDNTVLIAIDAERRGQMMTWFDTIKDRMMAIDTITDLSPEHFVFSRPEREGGHTYSFTPMDLDTYNDKVKGQLISGKDYDNLDDMIKAFQETKDEAW